MTSPKWDAAKTVSDNAKERLPELARQFFVAGREAAKVGTPYHALHRFRLDTKRFRYTLELFRDYYGAGLEARIESLRDLQQLLGAISDCSATQDLLAGREDLSSVARASLRRKLEGAARVRVAAFRRHWAKEFSSSSRERSWTDYLSRFARPKRHR